MKKSAFLFLTVFFMACGLCWSQAPDDSAPATSNIPSAQYPRIHSDLRITFQVFAPTAQKVQVQPGGNDGGLGSPVSTTIGC